MNANRLRLPLPALSLFAAMIFAAMIFLSSCEGGESEARRAARDLLATMTVAQKASQVLMTGISGNSSFPASLNARFRGAVPGAVLLFRYNIAPTPAGVAEYIRSCQESFSSLDPAVPVAFAIDHEGGDVYRTGKVTSYLPSAKKVASDFSDTAAQALYKAAGLQLSALGINMNLAPVVETLNPVNAVFLGTRAYSDNRDIVRAYASSAMRGYRSSGVVTVLKHFPGNGEGDPHSLLPVLDVTTAEFEDQYVKPFRDLLPFHPDAVLVSHIIVPVVEKGIPFCLSKPGVTGLLRKKLGFSGLIITDDISMGAIAKSGYSPADAAILALKAGCDMVMILSPDIRPVVEAIAGEAGKDPEFAERLDEAVLRILAMKAGTALVKKPIEGYSETEPFSGFDADTYFELRENGEDILEGKNDR